LKRWLLIIATALLGTWVCRTYLVEGIYIASASMEPNFPVGTHLFLNKMVYRFKSPLRGEVIVFKSPVEDKDLVKRVIALPGETVELREKQVYINGQLFSEPYAKHFRGEERLIGDNMEPTTVPGETVFVLGDNRDFSGDSRDWKNPQTGERIPFIPFDSIKGRIISLID